MSEHFVLPADNRRLTGRFENAKLRTSWDCDDFHTDLLALTC